MLIKNGNIHDGLGSVECLDLRIEDGMIIRLDESITPLPGEEVFDATGDEVLPGFVQPISLWGVNGNMTEIRPSSNDNDEHSDPITPQLDGFYAFNGRAASSQQLGAFGVTSCGVAPTDNNLFGGTIAAFTVDGVNPYKMCLKRDVGMMSSVTGNVKQTYGAKQTAPTTRMWIFAAFSEQLRKAAEYHRDKDKPADDKLEVLKRVIDGELPLFVSCDSQIAAQRVWEIVSKYPDIRLVLVNGFGLTGDEQWIIDHRIPLIVRTAADPLDEAAMTLDMEAIVRFAERGVPVALSGAYSNSMNIREDMLWNGIEMMRLMHDSNRVLPMLTSVPAQILGLDDVTGSLREGLRADLVVWSADPLKTWQAEIIRTYMGGRIIYQKGDELKCM